MPAEQTVMLPRIATNQSRSVSVTGRKLLPHSKCRISAVIRARRHPSFGWHQRANHWRTIARSLRAIAGTSPLREWRPAAFFRRAMEAYQWFLLGMIAGFIPGIVVLALIVR